MDASQTAPFRVGAAEVDITPNLGTQLAGDIGRYRPAESVHDRLYARALVVEAGERKLCLLSLDLAGVTGPWSDRIRRRAAEVFGFAPEAVMVHALQLHSAPAVGDDLADHHRRLPPALQWVRGSDEAYNPFAVERCLEAIGQACAALAPADMGYANTTEARVAFNRRFVMRDGTAVCHPPNGDPNILYAEGPIDPQLGVVYFMTEGMQTRACLLHYTCHPCHGYPHRYVSADWPGAWGRGMRATFGPACVPLVINGCCGNIHHNNHLDRDWVNDADRMGRLLTETSRRAIKGPVALQSEPALDWQSRHIRIPIREVPAAELQAAQDLLARHPEPIWADEAHTQVTWDWVYAVSRLDLHEERQREPEYDYEIQVLRIGDVALVGLPGEMFVEGGLQIKLGSPAYPTYVLHNCNAYAGYIPTRHALARGGYETRTAAWSKLAPEALEMIAETSVQMLKEMF